jgi:hypothetical protein
MPKSKVEHAALRLLLLTIPAVACSSPSPPPASACRWGAAKARDSLGFKRGNPGALRSADRLKDGAFLACVTGKTRHRASLERERSLDRLDDVAE